MKLVPVSEKAGKQYCLMLCAAHHQPTCCVLESTGHDSRAGPTPTALHMSLQLWLAKEKMKMAIKPQVTWRNSTCCGGPELDSSEGPPCQHEAPTAAVAPVPYQRNLLRGRIDKDTEKPGCNPRQAGMQKAPEIQV